MSDVITPADNEVFDPETNQWVTIETPIITEDTETNEPTDFMDIPTEQTDIVNCTNLGKRHKYKDRASGQTYDYCIVCGKPRSQPAQQRSSTPRVTGGKSANSLDMLLSGAWMALGLGVRHAVPKPVGPAVGKTIKLEAGIAGPRLHKTLKKTPLYPYIAIAAGQFSWATELATLLAPPLIVGLIAAKPAMAETLKPVLVAALVPVLAEAAKKAEQQAALLSALEGYDEQTVNAAIGLVDNLLESDDDESEAA